MFRRAYDLLVERLPRRGTLEYLRLLKLAAGNLECEVVAALELFLEQGVLPTSDAVRGVVDPPAQERPTVQVEEPDPSVYDELLQEVE